MNRSTIAGLVAVILFCVCRLEGQTEGWSGPALGFVYDPPTHSIRPLVGVPGSAYLGPPAVAGIDSGWVAPSGKSAVIQQKGRLALVKDLRQPEAQPMTTKIARVDTGSWAQDSSAFVAWSSQDRVLERWTNLAAEPLEETLGSGMPEGDVADLVAGPGARNLAIAVREAEATAYYLIQERAEPVLIGRCGGTASAAFSETGDTLYVADGAARQILRIQGLSASPAVELVLTSDGVSGVTALAALDGRRLVLVSASGKSVRIYDLAGQTLAVEMPIDDAPSQLLRLSGQRVFLLTSRLNPESPFFVLDARREPSVYFVPAGPQE